MVKIIGISGRKQSGKNTVANYIIGDILKSHEMIKDFVINNNGELEIKTSDASGHVGWGVFNVLRHDEEFISYAENHLWPYVKIYHFADYLKKICIDLFDLTPKQVYGTDADKNTDTPYDMTAREFLQYFGTDVMRKIKDTVWVDCTIKSIENQQSKIALIPDVRFPNEVDAIHRAGGTVVRLTRDVYKSDHNCETALDQNLYNWDNFDHIIHNDSSELSDMLTSLDSFKWLWR